MIGTVLGKMITYFGTDKKRINHAMKVYGFSCALWAEEAEDKNLSETDMRKETLLLAAILHDIGVQEAVRKYDSNDGVYQEKEGPSIADKILLDSGVEPKIRARVCYLVGHHHTYHLIDDLDFQILVEAEEIVNLEEDYTDRQAFYDARQITMKSAGAKKFLDSYLIGKTADTAVLPVGCIRSAK